MVEIPVRKRDKMVRIGDVVDVLSALTRGSMAMHPHPDCAAHIRKAIIEKFVESDTPATYAPTQPINTPCPACGSSSLIVGSDGGLVCGFLECRDPLMADRAIRKLDDFRTQIVAHKSELASIERALAPYLIGGTP